MVVKKVLKSKNNVKTKVKPKKSISSKKTKLVDKKIDKISQEDTELVEKTFDLVKKLNSDVGKVSLVKKKLENEVKKLNERINLQDENNKNKSSNLLVSLKEEIIKEFTPLLKRFDLKSVKIDMFKEISEILEIEIAKVKSSINSKNNKIKNDLKKEFSLIETRIIDALKSNENLNRRLNKFEKIKVKSMFLEMEEKLNETFKIKQNEIMELFNSNINKIEELKEKIELEKKEQLKLNNNLSKFKTDIKKLISEDNMDLTSVISKVDKLEKDHKSINSLISSFEDKLYSLNGEISKEISLKFEKDIIKLNNLIKDLDIKQKGIEELVFDEAKKIVKTETLKILEGNFNKYTNKLEIKFDNLKKIIDESNINIKNSFEEINIEKEAQQDLLINRYNEMVNKIDKFETEINKKNNQEIKLLKENFINELKKEIDKDSKNQEKNNLNIENKLSTMRLDLNLAIKESLDKFNSEKIIIEKKFEDTKDELLILVKNYINEVDKEILNIKNVNNKIISDKENLEKIIKNKTEEITLKLDNALEEIDKEKIIEREVVTSKINEIIDRFETLAIDNKVLLSESEKKINKNLSENIENEFNIIKEDIARFKLKNREFLKKISDDNNEDKIKNSKIIEEKISNSISKLEEEIKNNIIEVTNKIKNIEEKFNDDLEKQLKEKDIVIKDLDKFRNEITEHTKKFIEDVDLEIKNIKIEEGVFNEKKELAIGEFNEFISIKKEEIKDLEKNIELQISKIIEEEKAKQERNDENFKNLFNEKISNLTEVTNNKLNKIENKFIEKNISEVMKVINLEKEELNLIKLNLTSKTETISKQLEEIDNKQKIVYEDLKSEEVKLNERIENKLKKVETELNKKFLGIDSKFTDFKSIVIDEVEDLIKEVQSIISKKVSMFDKNMAKITFLSNETTNRINDFNRIAKGFENEMINMRNEISDIKVKAEIMTPEVHSLNDHIHYMQTYEEQLIGVIRSLKHRGLTDDSIQNALSNKGHPRFYVAMILKEFEELFN